jgi:hypothetical protein
MGLQPRNSEAVATVTATHTHIMLVLWEGMPSAVGRWY